MPYVVIPCPFTAKALIQSHASPCGIDSYWTKWQRNKVISKYFGSPISVSFQQCSTFIHSFTHSLIHSSRQPRYINTHPSLFAGSFFARSPQESKYTTRTVQWKGISKLSDNSNRPSIHNVRCSREESSNSHHNTLQRKHTKKY